MTDGPTSASDGRARADAAFARAVRREREAIDVHDEAARLADASAERLERAMPGEAEGSSRDELLMRAGRERGRAARARGRAAAARKRLADEGVPYA
jgi:hypothetical protein